MIKKVCGKFIVNHVPSYILLVFHFYRNLICHDMESCDKKSPNHPSLDYHNQLILHIQENMCHIFLYVNGKNIVSFMNSSSVNPCVKLCELIKLLGKKQRNMIMNISRFFVSCIKSHYKLLSNSSCKILYPNSIFKTYSIEKNKQ